MKLAILTLISAQVAGFGCAHYSDVVVGLNGVHEVSATPDEDDEDPDEEELSRDALSQATDYCAEVMKLKPQILSAKKTPVPNTDRSVYQVVVKFKCR